MKLEKVVGVAAADFELLVRDAVSQHPDEEQVWVVWLNDKSERVTRTCCGRGATSSVFHCLRQLAASALRQGPSRYYVVHYSPYVQFEATIALDVLAHALREAEAWLGCKLCGVVLVRPNYTFWHTQGAK